MLLHDHHLPRPSQGYSLRDQILEAESFQDWIGMSFDDGSVDGESGEKDFAEHSDSSSSSFENKEEKKKKTNKLQLVGENHSVTVKQIHCRESLNQYCLFTGPSPSAPPSKHPWKAPNAKYKWFFWRLEAAYSHLATWEEVEQAGHSQADHWVRKIRIFMIRMTTWWGGGV